MDSISCQESLLTAQKGKKGDCSLDYTNAIALEEGSDRLS